ncbi:TPA: hypothetical protein N0F65_004467 [Lagenidium giganteum]|uniref:protein-histidine N-methyltransferase n=1 Tax=Lagenidium giganteum TaxID=4803 RepID=A0AAV2ZGJ4_9STRA|nr:TPA: hypothetical protein N0F65_004467 [Lagenidium giganteum]
MTDKLRDLTASVACWDRNVLGNVRAALDEVARLRKKQASHAAYASGGSSEAALAAFAAWFQAETGANSPPLAIAMKHIDDVQGNGLVATQDIPAGQQFMAIPYRMVLGNSHEFAARTDSAADKRAWSLAARDPLLANMPSCLLALRVLAEACKKDKSYFHAYVAVLPSTFAIPLFYDADDFELLTGTDAFQPAVKLLYNSIKQFVYLHDFVRTQWSSGAPIPLTKFTIANYFWALGVALTRQNELRLQAADGASALGLIPGWDLCNHESSADGKITTFSDPHAQLVTCETMRAFRAGEQVRMFYGPRSNKQLLLYSGFVVEGNVHNRVPLAFSVDAASDPLAKIRQMVLSKAAPSPALTPGVVAIELDTNGAVVSNAMKRAVQVLCMEKNSLGTALRSVAAVVAEDRLFEVTKEEAATATQLIHESCVANSEHLQRKMAQSTSAAHVVVIKQFLAGQVAVLTTALNHQQVFES